MNKLNWVFILLFTPIAAYVGLLAIGGNLNFDFSNVGLFTGQSQVPNNAPTIIAVATGSNGNILIQATSNDDIAVTSIIIFLNGAEVRTCTTFDNPQQAQCTYQGTLTSGNYVYKALASDATHTVASQDKTFTV